MAKHPPGEHHGHAMPGNPNDGPLAVPRLFKVGESLNVITAGFAGDLGDEVQAVAQCPVAQRSHKRSSGNVWQQEKSLHRAIDSESLLIDDAVACTYDGDAMVAAGKK